MPRPKGSKNKNTVLPIDERVAAVSAEIASLQEELKKKKQELNGLKKEKEAEDQKKLMTAAMSSGKSIEELIALIEMAGKETEEN